MEEKESGVTARVEKDDAKTGRPGKARRPRLSRTTGSCRQAPPSCLLSLVSGWDRVRVRLSEVNDV